MKNFIFVCNILMYMLNRAIAYKFNKRIHHLILFITNRCNLRCKTCFVKFGREKELSLEEIKEISKDINNLSWLDITGGEPFLRDDLPEICSYFNTKVISIPTNGFNPERIFEIMNKLIDKTKAEIVISISIDGFEKTHDFIRSKGSFKKAIQTFKKLRQIKGIKLKVNTVICKRNLGEIENFMNFIYDLGPDFHSVILLRGDPRDKNYALPKLVELREKENAIFKIWKRYEYGVNLVKRRLLRNYHKYLWNVSLKTLENKRQIIPCVAGVAHGVVYANGDVGFCELLNPIGNIRKESFKRIWNSNEAKDLRIKIKNNFCYCTHNCVMIDNILLNPKSYMKLLWGD